MIRFLNHSITECKLIEKAKKEDNGQSVYELLHWWYSDDSPSLAGSEHIGYFKSYEEAVKHHHNILANRLLRDKE